MGVYRVEIATSATPVAYIRFIHGRRLMNENGLRSIVHTHTYVHRTRTVALASGKQSTSARIDKKKKRKYTNEIIISWATVAA